MSTNEWYTQLRYIKAAKDVMGSIELDPASCAAANQIVQAARYYTKEQDGLSQDWSSRSLWLNPPYGKVRGRSVCGMFIARLIQEYQTGRVEQAILLTMADTSTQWFQWLRDYPVCFAHHKVHFYTTNPTQANPTASHRHGTIFVYFGRHEDRFLQVFGGRIGDIWKRVDTTTRTVSAGLWQEAI